MAKVVKFPVSPPAKLGPRKVKKRKKPDLEAFGQLNLFEAVAKNTPVIKLSGKLSFFEYAMKLDEQNDPESEKYYLLAIDNGDSVEDAYCNLGIMMSQGGHEAKAIDYLTACLKVNPRHFEAHYNLANVYSEMSNFDLAKTHYEVAIRIDPQFPNCHYNLGLTYISLRKYGQAIESINTYIELAPDHDLQVATELIKTLKALA